MEKVRILNVDILSIKKQELLERLTEGVLFTPNVDHLVRLQKDKEFYRAYQQADWVVCDSVILHRLFRRYFIQDMQFFWYLLKQMLGLYKNPFEPINVSSGAKLQPLFDI